MAPSNEIAYLYQEGAIARYSFSGVEATTKLNFTVKDYFRQYDYQGYVFSIIQIVQNQNNDFDSNTISGYIGIAPYTGIPEAENQII